MSSTSQVPMRLMRFRMADAVDTGPTVPLNRPVASPKAPESARGTYEAGIPGGGASADTNKIKLAAVPLAGGWASLGRCGQVIVQLPATIVGTLNSLEIRFYRSDSGGESVESAYITSNPANIAAGRGAVLVADASTGEDLAESVEQVLNLMVAAIPGISRYFDTGNAPKLGSQRGSVWSRKTGLKRWGIFSPAGWPKATVAQSFFTTTGTTPSMSGDGGTASLDAKLRGIVATMVGKRPNTLVLPESNGNWARY